MSIAKKCDICGKLYEQYNTLPDKNEVNGFRFLNIDYTMEYYKQQVIDCCPECMESIKNHIEMLRYPVREGK